jgi:hypothetical protein
MTNDMQEERTRTLAYELWQADGSPEGRADEYWERARARIEEGGEAQPGETAQARPPEIAEGAFDEDVDTTDAVLKH